MSVYTDSKTVATPGTVEALTARSVKCASVIVKAKKDNTDSVYVVDLSDDTKKFPLEPGESVTVPTSSPSIIKVDVEVAGEGFNWLAM